MIGNGMNQEKVFKVGNEVISIDGVKGDSSLFRVMINQTFKGYVQERENKLFMVDGSDIHYLIFAKICQCLENNSCA